MATEITYIIIGAALGSIPGVIIGTLAARNYEPPDLGLWLQQALSWPRLLRGRWGRR